MPRVTVFQLLFLLEIPSTDSVIVRNEIKKKNEKKRKQFQSTLRNSTAKMFSTKPLFLFSTT